MIIKVGYLMALVSWMPTQVQERIIIHLGLHTPKFKMPEILVNRLGK